MSKCEYAAVLSDQPESTGCAEGNDRSWKPFFRQLVVSSAVWSGYFQFGLCLGTPTVVIPRMRADYGQDYISPEMASWMSSVMSYGAIPWPVVIALLATRFGRRCTFALGVASSLAGFALLAAGDSPTHVLGSMAVQGMLAALQVTITLLVLTEYTSPQYRGAFLTIKSATAFWGMWAANAIGTVAHWHYIAWLGLACGVYSAMTLLFWPESPYWLAAQGRMELCARAHHQLKGRGASSQKELRELIQARQQAECSEKSAVGTRCTRVWRELRSKAFYKPLLLSAVLATQYQLSGKVVCSVYAIDIIRALTGSEREAYRGMLVLDGVTVLGMYCGCALSRLLRRRTLLLAGGALAGGLLLAMAVQLRLVKSHLLADNKYLTLALLVGFSISVCCGPIILNSTLSAELLPLRMRAVTLAIVGMILHITMGTSLKVAPYIFSSFGMDGAFLFYGLTSTVLLVLLYVYLPETKDKTLKEIEQSILGGHADTLTEHRDIRKLNFENSPTEKEKSENY